MPTTTTEPSSNLLLKLLMEDMTNRLEKQAIETIRPAIRKSAREAVEALKPKIEQHYEHYADKMTMALIINGEVEQSGSSSGS